MAVVHLEETSYSVNEGNRVELCAIVDTPNGCHITFPFNLTLTHRPSSGICNIFELNFIFFTSLTESNEDYGPVPTKIHFGSCYNRVCVDVPTRDDNIVENAETFTVTLGIDSSLSRMIRVKSPTATITIHDNDIDGG